MLFFAPWKIVVIFVVIALGAVFAAPNLLSEDVRDSMPGFLPSKAVNLGLDLRGGSHLLYEVDVSGVRASELEAGLDRARTIVRDEDCDDASAPRAGLFCPTIAAAAVLDDYATLRIAEPGDYDEALRRLRAELPRANQASVPIGLGGAPPRIYDVEPGEGTGEIRITVTEDALEDVRRRTIAQSIEIVRRRIDQMGTTEPIIQRQGADRILVQVPGVADPQRLKEIIGRTAQMTFHLVAPADAREIERAVEGGRLRANQVLMPADDGSYMILEERLRPSDTVRDSSLNPPRSVRTLSGQYLQRATQGFHPQTGEPIVNFTFNRVGAEIFAKLTSNHAGGAFAVVLDGEIITAPRIRQPITGGSGFIEGGFTLESASDLAALLEAGALPAPLTVVEERSVGPGLGQDSVEAGTFALVVGFAAVVVFMLIAYRLFGVFANLALFANVVLIAGALSGLQATLTLPGIAGIILTIGMAVDANVLIFERIREEARGGRTPANAIEAGYSRALSAILDANITTLIAAALLFWFGSGPVRGFAVTLAIGIVTSVFTAFVFSRFLVATWFRATRPRALAL